MQALAAQLAMELRLTLRRGENLVVTLGIPLLLLVFLANVDLIGSAAGGPSRLDQLVPGILCLALISTGLVSLGIATAFERGNGTLKRLASSPLPRWALVAAKTGCGPGHRRGPGGGARRHGDAPGLGPVRRPARGPALGKPLAHPGHRLQRGGRAPAGRPAAARGDARPGQRPVPADPAAGWRHRPARPAARPRRDTCRGPAAGADGRPRARCADRGCGRRCRRRRSPWVAGRSCCWPRPWPPSGSTKAEAARKRERPWGRGPGSSRSICGLVAGDGFEPPTFGL